MPNINRQASNTASQAQWLFPETTIRTLLRTRPLALDPIEKIGADVWSDLDQSITFICSRYNVGLAEFLSTVGNLAVPSRDSDWLALPVYHLLDFLTQEHRNFIDGKIPSIRYMLEMPPRGDEGSLQFLQNMREEFDVFARGAAAHIREEEDFLFPKILRNEASLRHGYVDPDFAAGSVRVYVGIRMLENEAKFRVSAFQLRDKVENGGNPAAGHVSERLESLILELDAELRRHSRLELDMLYPMASRIEKELYGIYIGGRAKPNRETRNADLKY